MFKSIVKSMYFLLYYDPCVCLDEILSKMIIHEK